MYIYIYIYTYRHLRSRGREVDAEVLGGVPRGTVINSKTTASQKCGAVRGELVCKAHILLYHSTLGSRVMKKKKKLIYWGMGN